METKKIIALVILVLVIAFLAWRTVNKFHVFSGGEAVEVYEENIEGAEEE